MRFIKLNLNRKWRDERLLVRSTPADGVHIFGTDVDPEIFGVIVIEPFIS